MRKRECENCRLRGAFYREGEFNRFCETLRAPEPSKIEQDPANLKAM